MSLDGDLVLMGKDRVLRSLNRMAHEIAEKNFSDRPVILFGIDQRGYAIAKVLANILQPMFGNNVQSIQLLLDKDSTGDEFQQSPKDMEQNPFLIVVDDVIFSGTTMFSALKIITEKIKTTEIHTAVLIDRGHRKFPVKAEFFGMEFPTKLNEHVSVVVKREQVQKVVLQKK